MYKVKKKIESASPLGKLKAKVLRMFGENMGFESSGVGHKVTAEEDSYPYLHGEIKRALLDAEYKKALILMEWQNRRHIY